MGCGAIENVGHFLFERLQSRARITGTLQDRFDPAGCQFNQGIGVSLSLIGGHTWRQAKIDFPTRRLRRLGRGIEKQVVVRIAGLPQRGESCAILLLESRQQLFKQKRT